MDEKARQEEEKGLLDLLSLIRGDRWMGSRGLRTYPDDADEATIRSEHLPDSPDDDVTQASYVH